jgi:hypothetical protein
MLKRWNRARSQLDLLHISIEYLSQIHVQLIIGIPDDRFLSVCHLKLYMFFLFPTLPIPLYPPLFRHPDSRRQCPITNTSLLPYSYRNYLLNASVCRVLFFMGGNNWISLCFGLGQEGKNINIVLHSKYLLSDHVFDFQS